MPPAPRRSTRNKSPSLKKAITIYEEAVRAIQRELAEFEAQKYLFKSLEDLPSTDIRPRYRKLRMREQALLLASEDLRPLLEKRGLMQDARKIQEEVDYLITPITNIKLTYMDLVSNVTGSVRQEADDESTDQPMPTYQIASPGPSPCRVTALLQDTVCSSTSNSCPSNTATTNVLSGGIPSILSPPEISLSTHYHAVVCNSATCLGDRVITTPCPTPQGVTSHARNPSPPHQATSCPQQHNQAPREYTSPSSAQPVSREELHSVIANMYHNIQDMLTKLLTQRKEETTMPVDVRNTNNTSRRNRTRSSSCQSCSPKRAVTNAICCPGKFHYNPPASREDAPKSY